MRDEHRGQRHHDQEVEEEHPAGDEAGKIVERPAHEGRRASGLGERRGALGVGERDQEEDHTGDEQDERREAERGPGDDPERDVQGGRDLPVRDREERGRVEDALEPADLPRHLAPPLPLDREARDAEHDEEPAEDVPDHASAGGGRADEKGNPDPDEDHARTRAPRPSTSSHGLAAVTRTRQPACFST